MRLMRRQLLYRESSRMKHPKLTNRQSQVMDCLLRGMCTKEIARELGISVNTVKCHAQQIYYRLNVSGRYKLMAKWGHECGVSG